MGANLIPLSIACSLIEFITALPVLDVAAFTILLPALLTRGVNKLFTNRNKPPIPLPRCNLSPPLKRSDIFLLLTFFFNILVYLSWFYSMYYLRKEKTKKKKKKCMILDLRRISNCLFPDLQDV